MKTYSMMVLGCKVTDYEANYVREKMNSYFFEVDFKQKADICIIFTCCVTNVAEAKSRKFIHDARRNNPDAFIVSVGCFSQIKSNTPVFNDVDLIIGSDKKNQIVDLILQNKKANYVSEKINDKFEELFISSYQNKTRSFLKIQDGCNQFCSYCVIPYSRGRERSGNHLNLINQAKILSQHTKEIVLTGIHTGRYNDGEYDLYHLLKDLVTIEGLETIRLSSIEITEITDEIIDLMVNNNKIAPHLHIPVQSCDNDILKLMNRPYTIEQFKDRIKQIRSAVNGISISTDLIVGFPKESEQSFANTLNNLKDIRFSFLHVFPYSAKEGTVAAKMNGQIDPKLKKSRIKQINELESEIHKEFCKNLKGKNSRVLIERNDGVYSYGYCLEYIYTKVPGIYQKGDMLSVKLDYVDDEVIGNAA